MQQLRQKKWLITAALAPAAGFLVLCVLFPLPTDRLHPPSSTVVLDKFIYDPESGADEVVLKVTKGALRFISSGSGNKNVIIKTPSALMGIRG